MSDEGLFGRAMVRMDRTSTRTLGRVAVVGWVVIFVGGALHAPWLSGFGAFLLAVCSWEKGHREGERHGRAMQEIDDKIGLLRGDWPVDR